MLYQIVDAHLETFLAEACERSPHGFGLPGFVERTFARYLECGILSHGFCRVRWWELLEINRKHMPEGDASLATAPITAGS